MARRATRLRQNRRDRRKAKESGFAREGTSNPKRVGHHLYEHNGLGVHRRKYRPLHPESYRVVYDDGPVQSNLGLKILEAWQPCTEE